MMDDTGYDVLFLGSDTSQSYRAKLFNVKMLENGRLELTCLPYFESVSGPAYACCPGMAVTTDTGLKVFHRRDKNWASKLQHVADIVTVTVDPDNIRLIAKREKSPF
jgi:hypothetical protein